MPLSANQQALYDHAKASLPRILFQSGVQEVLRGFAVMFDLSRGQVQAWLDLVAVNTSTGVWLDQLARDRGTSRRSGETDAALRLRIRSVEDAVTAPALRALVAAIMAQAGVAWTQHTISLRRDRAFMLRDRTPLGGVGDSFTKVGNVVTLVDAAGTFTGGLMRMTPFGVRGESITIAGATSAGNNGTFVITAVNSSTSVSYTNAAGVAEAFTGTWQLDSIHVGRSSSYLGRGYRMSRRNGGLVVILPFGTTLVTANAVKEALRTRRAAGFGPLIVERRTSP